MRGDGHAYIAFLCVFVVDAGNIIPSIVAVVASVAAGEEVVVDVAAGDLDEGGSLHGLIFLMAGTVSVCIIEQVSAAHVAADVAAAIDCTHMAGAHLNPGAAEHIAHLAAAIEIVDQHVGAVHHDMGAVVDVVRGTLDFEGTKIGGDAGSGHLAVHVARIAAAIDGAGAARSQRDGGHHCHRSLVVAAKEGTDIVDAGAVPGVAAVDCVDIVAAPSADSGREGLAGADAVHSHVGSRHAGGIAAGEDGVALASGDAHIGGLAHHLVAAAEKVANAEVAAQLIAVVIAYRRLGGGSVDRDMVLAVGLRAAPVVATEEGVDSAAVDGDGGAVGIGVAVGDEGVLGAAEEGVDLDRVVGRGDGGLDDGGDGQRVVVTRLVGPYHLPSYSLYRGAISHVLVRHCGSCERFSIIEVVAVAAAVDIVYPHPGGGVAAIVGRGVGVGIVDTQDDGRAATALHRPGDVVAAIDGADAVAVDDDHLGVACHVGHAAATEDRAINHKLGSLSGGEGVGRGGCIRPRLAAFGLYFVLVFCRGGQAWQCARHDLAAGRLYLPLLPVGVCRLLPVELVALGYIVPRDGDIVVIDLGGCRQGRVLACGLHGDSGRLLLRDAAGICDRERQGRRLVARKVLNPVVQRRGLTLNGVKITLRRKREVRGSGAGERPFVFRYRRVAAVGAGRGCGMVCGVIVVVVACSVLRKGIVGVGVIGVRCRDRGGESLRSVVGHRVVRQVGESSARGGDVFCGGDLAEAANGTVILGDDIAGIIVGCRRQPPAILVGYPVDLPAFTVLPVVGAFPFRSRRVLVAAGHAAAVGTVVLVPVVEVILQFGVAELVGGRQRAGEAEGAAGLQRSHKETVLALVVDEIVVVGGAGDVLLNARVPDAVGTERGGILQHIGVPHLDMRQVVVAAFDLDDVWAVAALRPGTAAGEEHCRYGKASAEPMPESIFHSYICKSLVHGELLFHGQIILSGSASQLPRFHSF